MTPDFLDRHGLRPRDDEESARNDSRVAFGHRRAVAVENIQRGDGPGGVMGPAGAV